MAQYQYANNPQTVLAGAVTAGDTSISVASGALFPTAGRFTIIVDSELMAVTGVEGTVWTVERGSEGTAAAAHNNNAAVTGILTRASLFSASHADVRSYGATGNGTTDDTAAIQKAADSGDHVYFPKGTYLLHGTVSVTTAGQKFFGPGTIAFSAAGTRSNATIEMFSVAAEEVSFDGLTFDGKNATWSGAAPAHDWMLYFGTGSSRSRVTNCVFKNMSRPVGHLAAAIGVIGQASTIGVVVSGNQFKSMGGGAIFFQSADCIASSNFIDTCGDIAIAINSAEARGCIINGNTVLNMADQAAIAVEETAADWVISNNMIRNCQRAFQVLHVLTAGPTVGGGQFVNNEVINTTTTVAAENHAVHITSQYYRNITIRGNRFIGLTAKTTSSSFIYIEAATDGMTIEDNVMEANDAAVNGVTIADTGTHSRLTIRRNTIRAITGGTQLQRGVWIAAASTHTGADISDNFFHEISGNGIEFNASVSWTGRMANNRFFTVAVAILNGPFGTMTAAPSTPHSFDNSATSTSFTVEEGSWTPVVSGAETAGTATYTIQYGRYRRIGKLVWVEARATYSGHTGTGAARFSLPFTSTANSQARLHVNSEVLAAASVWFVIGSSTNAGLLNMTTAADVAVPGAGTLWLSGVYEAA